MEGKSTSSELDEAIASFHGIIESQLESISAFEARLDKDYAYEPVLQEVVSAIKLRLSFNRNRLMKVRQTCPWPSSASSSPQGLCWGSISRTLTANVTTSDSLTLTGLEGEPERHFEIGSINRATIAVIKRFVRFVTTVFSELEATECRIQQVAGLIHELEEASLSGSPAGTVTKHIGLLGRYNDAKDMGQQLLGLVADNRAVPVGTLYQDNQYGVSADD